MTDASSKFTLIKRLKTAFRYSSSFSSVLLRDLTAFRIAFVIPCASTVTGFSIPANLVRGYPSFTYRTKTPSSTIPKIEVYKNSITKLFIYAFPNIFAAQAFLRESDWFF